MTAQIDARGERLRAYALLAGLAIAVCLPSIIGGPSDTIDHPWHLMWADAFAQIIAEGTLYPRWWAEGWGGLGAPSFYFQPPLGYWLASPLMLLGMAPGDALTTVYALAFFCAGVGTFEWLAPRARWPLLGAAVFLLAPYHVLDFNPRGAFAESVAIAILPWFVLAMERVVTHRRWIAAAIAYALIIYAHLPFALVVTLFLVPVFLWHHRTREAWASYLRVGITGLLLAAPYLLPVLAFDGYRATGPLHDVARFQPANWTLWRLDWSSYWVREIIPTYVVLGTALLILAVTAKSPSDEVRLGLIGLIAITLVPWLWELPLLDRVQFPFRALPLVEFALACAIARAPQGRVALIAAIPVLLLGAYATVPRTPPAGLPPVGTFGSAANLPREAYGGTKQSLTIAEVEAMLDPAPPPPGQVVAPHFYWPSWSCGTPEPNSSLLLHPATCTPRQRITRTEWAAYALAFLGVLLMLGQALLDRRKIRANVG
ncbi:6-pyruvoyl-tetrahydropterin synthase-related protein [Sphingomicrobium arenosum]|uniref:6-pyruvoyl-tetrahydropterin synthase-related protein n=1 Tax=Sphingomicrobium arenosum TaxID=2233861 RepID=UPI0022410427|nr:6-pyruvoyl-tetrahydropterin synthase-related protein [Sphingomicrobium arenosum]